MQAMLDVGCWMMNEKKSLLQLAAVNNSKFNIQNSKSFQEACNVS